MSDAGNTFDWRWQGRPVRVRFDRLGDGPPLVLLPALSTVSSCGEMAALARLLASGWQVIVPDWPGFGAGRHRDLGYLPGLLAAFLRDFAAEQVRGPAALVATGHAAGYALAEAARARGTWTRVALIAPTWRGPLPTMMQRHAPIQDRIRRVVGWRLVGPALYRLNTARPVIAMMYRRHVFADAARLTPALLDEKIAVARRPGGRFASAAFVTGGLDPVRSRAEFLALAEASPVPLLALVPPDAPPRSAAEMRALVAVPGVQGQVLARGTLGVAEEFPDLVAPPLLRFLAETNYGVRNSAK
ncbi:MAG TPA: alpha/beta fold hydrolase [Acetobacteraceae bacterium]|nr:alpha/beta fold hydrolase [Acetobacteraceae bacterium]